MAYDHQIQAFVVSHRFVGNVAELILAPGSCADMAGCIRFFTSRNPHIRAIQVWTLSDGQQVPDTVYQRENGQWHASLTRPTDKKPRRRARPQRAPISLDKAMLRLV